MNQIDVYNKISSFIKNGFVYNVMLKGIDKFILEDIPANLLMGLKDDGLQVALMAYGYNDPNWDGRGIHIIDVASIKQTGNELKLNRPGGGYILLRNSLTDYEKKVHRAWQKYRKDNAESLAVVDKRVMERIQS